MNWWFPSIWCPIKKECFLAILCTFFFLSETNQISKECILQLQSSNGYKKINHGRDFYSGIRKFKWSYGLACPFFNRERRKIRKQTKRERKRISNGQQKLLIKRLCLFLLILSYFKSHKKKKKKVANLNNLSLDHKSVMGMSPDNQGPRSHKLIRTIKN